jgi:fructosamine-3-kinase
VSALPLRLHTALQQTLNTEQLHVEMLSGGMVNRAARVETSDGAVFVKWSESATPAMYRAEADGLHALRSTQSLRVPDVIAMGQTPPFLVLEFIEEHTNVDTHKFTQTFACSLAQMHRNSHCMRGFGFADDNFIGALPQRNMWHQDWPSFYRECRLKPQIEMARQRRLLPATREHALLRVLDNLEKLLSALPAKPALLHGDLWSGNFLSAGDEPVIFDPAAYYGEREMEIAYIELFGGFPAGFVRAYNDVYPLESGYQRRRPLHQLYPLLVHLNHFGETYGPRVDRACEMCRTALL